MPFGRFRLLTMERGVDEVDKGGGRVRFGVVPPQRGLVRSWLLLLRHGEQHLATAAPPFLVSPA